MAMTPSQIGARAEAAVAAALTAQGGIVYLPAFAGHGRVDLVFADVGGLHGVQCKAARRVGDVLCFRTCSNTSNHPKAYGPEVEYFGVYFHERNQVFLVPVSGTPARECSLRLAGTRNGQAARVRWADDYLIGPEPAYRLAAAGAPCSPAPAPAPSSHATRGASDHSRSRS